MVRYSAKILLTALTLALCGCESMVDFSDWSAGYDKAIEQTHNQNMLVNMIRAAYNRPLHFTAVSGVRGNGQISPSLGLTGSFPFHRLTDLEHSGAVLGVGPTLAVSGGYNFDMVSLDNAEFMTGLLTPIAPSTVNFYVGQGIPREILFNLLIQKVTISDGNHSSTYVNDPTRADYQDFRITLGNLLSLGLTTESVSSLLPFGPPLTTAEAKDPRILTALAQAMQAGVFVQPASPNTYQIVKPLVQARFCFTGGAPGMPKLPASALCNKGESKPKEPQKAQGVSDQNFAAGSSIPGFENASLIVTVRSTREVFNFLGNLIYMQLESDKHTNPQMETAEAREYNYLKRGDDLLVVLKNQSRSDDIVSIDYEGNTYSIPTAHQGNSALVFTMVSQILTLSKSINLIPTTSAVEVR